MANFLRTRVVNRFSNYIMLLKKGIKTAREEGIRQAFYKTKRYIRGNYSIPTCGTEKDDYEKWMEKNKLTPEKVNEIKRDISLFNYKPKISIIMPVYNVDKIWLEKAIESVINQLYENWELCIADNGSTKEHIKKTLEFYEQKDKRIKVKYLQENQGISRASNEALSMATGEFIGLLDHDDELSIDALYENVKLLNENADADLIYSDEDKIDDKDKRMEPFFKPDYSPDMLLSINYICHFSVFRKSILDEIGWFRKEYDGAQDYDLLLRFTEKTTPERILHIPKILYHWRKITGSTAMNLNAKDYALLSGKRAIEDYLNRNGIYGSVSIDDRHLCYSYRVKREIKNSPEVGIIIPFKDKVELLKKCTDSILQKTTYKNYKIILVDNKSEKEETFEFLDEIIKIPIVSYLKYEKPFNFSSINNYAASLLESDIILFLNNDVEVISKDWIEAMLEFALRIDVGAVGSLLLYPDAKVQHAGVIIGLGGVAGHSHKYFNVNSNGYFGRLRMIQNFSAVTAACMMTRRNVFFEVGGFDENYSHAFNDVDYCLKLREKGYLIVYTPYARLHHHESQSRGYEDTVEKQIRFKKEIEYFQAKWKHILERGDPYYNPNLTLDREDFSIKI